MNIVHIEQFSDKFNRISSKDPRGALLHPIVENIPPRLTRYKRRWGLWEATWNPVKKNGAGGWDKRPVALDGKTGRGANVKWNSFQEVCEALEVQSLVSSADLGLGFTLTKCNDLTILDLDGCVSATGDIAPWAKAIIDQAGTYAEFSPSGTGIRIAGLGRAAMDWTNHDRGLEVYAGHGARFLTMTGHRINGTAEDLQPLPDGFLDALQTEYRGCRSEALPDRSLTAEIPELLEVDELPRLEDLPLSAHSKAFLERGEYGADGSRAVAAAAITLLEATSTPEGLLRPDLVLSLLADNPHAWEIAKRHRREDDTRSLEYLWKHHVVPGMAKARPVTADFDNLDETEGAEGGDRDKTERQRGGLETFSLADLAGQAVPTRKWLVDGIVPAGTVSLLYGDGGVGKSLLSLQLAVSMASGAPWVGLPCSTGRTLYLSAEDDKDEIHIRATDVTAAIVTELKDLPDVRVAPLAGRDAVLAEAAFGRGKIESTKLWRDVRAKVAEFRPALVIIDNLADVFAGNENERTLAQQFVAQMRGLCSDFQTTVVLLAHPSQSGMASGTGSSGSTAWHNSVRSRLYFRRPENATPETDMRVLESKKNNYGVTGKVLATVQWRNGAFHALTEGDRSEASEARRAIIREAFMAAFSAKEKARTTVSPNRSAAWAPSVFAKEAAASRDPKAPRYTSVEYAVAMDELLAADVLAIGTKGRGARATEILVRGKVDLPQDDLSVDSLT